MSITQAWIEISQKIGLLSDLVTKFEEECLETGVIDLEKEDEPFFTPYRLAVEFLDFLSPQPSQDNLYRDNFLDSTTANNNSLYSGILHELNELINRLSRDLGKCRKASRVIKDFTQQGLQRYYAPGGPGFKQAQQRVVGAGLMKN